MPAEGRSQRSVDERIRGRGGEDEGEYTGKRMRELLFGQSVRDTRLENPLI